MNQAQTLTWNQARDMTLSTGKAVWYLHPERTPIELQDLRTPVENICRYNGGLRWHLIRHLALGVLLCRERFGVDDLARNIAGYYAAHDLHEGVVGDIVSGMKKYVPGFRSIEAAWEAHVHEEIGLPMDMCLSRRAVRELDMLALVVEMTRLDHPAVEIAKLNTGLEPSEEELHCFDHVANMSVGECWDLVVEAIETTKSELPWQQK